jgi:hypothetical protein
MKKNFFLTLIPIFLLVCTHLSAQTKPSKQKPNTPKPAQKDDTQPNKGQSKDVQVFDANGKDDYDYFVKKNANNPKNVIKINPLEVLDGSFPVFYERVIHPKFSVEVGLGVTTVSSTFAEFRSALSNSAFYDGFVKGKTGTMFKIGVRYYASKGDDAPEGSYFAAEYQVKKFNFDAYKMDINGSRISSAPYQATSVTNSDLLRLLFGYQYEGNSNFKWDTFIGLGWRTTTLNGWYLNDNSKAVLGSVSNVKPVFIIGFKLGVAF